MTKQDWRAHAKASDRKNQELMAAVEGLARKLAELAEAMTVLTRTLTTAVTRIAAHQGCPTPEERPRRSRRSPPAWGVNGKTHP